MKSGNVDSKSASMNEKCNDMGNKMQRDVELSPPVMDLTIKLYFLVTDG